jgi:predicted TIM-barrel fold metal-dependent hydrolase
VRDGLLVIDAHTHIAPHAHTTNNRVNHVPTDWHVERMDRYGIDIAVVIAHAHPGWKLDDYRREHDLVADEIARFPDRLVGVCWADPHLGDDAVNEFDRCVRDLGYRALKLHPVYQRFAFDSPIVDPLLEHARTLKLPVVAHLEPRISGAEPWRMVRLAERYPDITFVMAHMGRNVQSIQDGSIARLAGRVPNIVLEASSTTTDAYGTFQQVAKILGPERIMFGTDSGPFHHPAINLLKVELLDLPREWSRLMLSGNAERIYGIDSSTFGRAPAFARGVFETPRGAVHYPCPAPSIQ